VAELAEPFAVTQPAISKHLKVLEAAGLIIRDRDAQRRPSRLEAAPLAEASAWLEDYRSLWKGSSAHKVDAVEEPKQKKKKKNKHKKH
jgi:DNA-binding transcriptional ArsR family regulator